MTVNSDGTVTSAGNIGSVNSKPYTIHGWLMWISWSLLCIVQVSINRYGKSLWKWHHLIHSVVGFTITVTVGYAAISMI
jgi:hypothetical protein